MEFWVQLALGCFGGILILAVGVWLARLLRRRGSGLIVQALSILVFGLIGLSSIASTLARNLPNAPSAKMQTYIVRQPANGLSNATLDLPYLKKVEGALLDGITKGVPSLAHSISAHSSYIEIDGKRLGIVRLLKDNVVIMVSIFGIDGPNLVRLTCGKSDGSLVNPSDEACAREQKTLFGAIAE